MVEEETTERMFPISYTFLVLLIVSLASLFYLAFQKLYIDDIYGVLIVLLQGLFVGFALMLGVFYRHVDEDFGKHSKIGIPTAISFGLLMGIGMALAIMFVGNWFSLFSFTGVQQSIFSSVSGITFDYTFSSGVANMFNFTAFFSLSGVEIATVFLTCFFTAMSEESFFRFVIPSFMYRVRGEHGYWESTIMGLIIFGMYHAFVGGIMIDLVGGTTHAIMIAVLGVVFIIIYYYTRSLVATFAFHFVYNFLVISGALIVSLMFLGISVGVTVLWYYYKKMR